jgi:glycosidase
VDPIDPRAVAPSLGTLADLDSLVADTHARGMRLLLSLVVNHTSDRHPWFRDAAAGDSTKRSCYVFRPHDFGWTQPFDATRPTWHPLGTDFYYALWWSHAPDLELRNPAVRADLVETLRFWLSRGIDGFVVEDARYLVEDVKTARVADTEETLEVLAAIDSAVVARDAGATIVLEVFAETGETVPYHAPGGPRVSPWVTNASMQQRMVRAVRKGAGHEIARELTEMAEVLPPSHRDVVFLSHYKRSRVARELGEARDRLANVAALQMTLPGLALIYYGDELGLTIVESPSDASKRAPMPWTAAPPGFGFSTGSPRFPFAEGAERDNVASASSSDRSLLSRYRALVRARAASTALREGTLTLVQPPEKNSPLVAFFREADGERVLVVHNVSDRPSSVRDVDLRPETTFSALFRDEGVAPPRRGDLGWQITMPPRSSAVWRID